MSLEIPHNMDATVKPATAQSIIVFKPRREASHPLTGVMTAVDTM
jgi:hypothetical protein